MARKKVEEKDKQFIPEEAGSDDAICLIHERIENNIEWLRDHYWNGWPSWKAAYLLDRTISWASKQTAADQNITAESEDVGEITIPIIANHIRNLLPFLFIRDPVFYGRPVKQEDIRKMIAQLDYLNAVWKQQKMSKQARRSVLDAAIIGHGICKTGWNIEIDYTEKPNLKGVINYVPYAKKENPWIRRINPFLFGFDRFSSDYDLESARWCYELQIKPIQDVVDNELYDLKVRTALLEGDLIPKTIEEFKKVVDPNDQSDFLFAPKKKEDTRGATYSPNQLIITAEFWDKKFDMVYNVVLCESEESRENSVLRKRKNPYSYLNNHPYVKVDFEEVPNEPYGIGHVRYLSDVGKMINRNRTKIFAVTRMFNPKWVHVGKEPLSTAAKQIIKDDEAGTVVDLGMEETLMPLNLPTLSQDLYNASSLMEKDFTELSGEDILSRGGLLPSRTSAEEIRERSKLRGLRLENNVSNTQEFVLEIAKQLTQHVRNNLRVDKAISVIGRPGIFWNKISKADLDVEFDVDINVISKTVDPPDVQRQAFTQLFQLVANPNMIQLLQTFQVPLNFSALFYKYLETFDLPEMMLAFPGIGEFPAAPIPQGLVPINTGNVPNTANTPTSPESTRNIQSDNVSTTSAMQGMEGIVANPSGS